MKEKTAIAEEHDEVRLASKYFNKLRKLKITLQMRQEMKLRKNENAKKHRCKRIFKYFKTHLQREIYYSKKFKAVNALRKRNCEKHYFKIMMKKFDMEKKSKRSAMFYRRKLLSKVIKYFKKQALKSISVKNILMNHLDQKEKVLKK